LQGYVQELFDLLTRSLPRPEEGDLRTEIDATPYESDRWIIGRIAEFIAHVNWVETARKFYRPVLELGQPGDTGLKTSCDPGRLQAFRPVPISRLCRNLARHGCVHRRPAWQPAKGNHWSRAEGLAVHPYGPERDGSKVLGDAKYKPLVGVLVSLPPRPRDRLQVRHPPF
jgi:hypothetical protein